MKLKEDFKGLKSKMGDEMSKAISQVDPSSHGDFMTASSEMMRSVDEESDIIRKPLKKGVSKKLVGKTKMKLPIGKLFSVGKTMNEESKLLELSKKDIIELIDESKNEVDEKWSEKYKKSIDCNNPKGFSQKAHCQGKKKKQVSEEKLKGGRADNKTFEDLLNKNKKRGKSDSEVEKMLKTQLNKGIKVEMEHTKNKSKAKEIAMDHLFEDPNYYDKLKKIEGKEATGAGSAGGFLGKVAFNPESDFVKKSFQETPKKVETKEATGSASSGSYVTPAAWAKSTSKKHWRGKSKTQIPGGKFVQVKSKCKKFPYCNQGDIKALKLTNESELNNAIKNISEREGISENIIKQILLHEYNKTK
jgi:hypothetical protein